MAEPLNTKDKHVVSSTLNEPLEWENSSLVRGELPGAVQALKQAEGGDLHVIGSTELVQSLLEHGLVDELRVMIDPVVLGGGKRFFSENGQLTPLSLVDGQVTSKGAILATYVPAS